MAIPAVLSEFVFMYIDCPVTGDALRLLEIIHLNGSMAGTADQILMFPLERKLCVVLMIEFHLGPTLDIVTILTLLAVAVLMHIVFLMT